MNKIIPFYFATSIYLALSVGFFILKATDNTFNLVISLSNFANLFFLYFMIFKTDSKLSLNVLLISIILFISILPSFVITNDTFYAIDKFIGFFILPLFVTTIFSFSIKTYGVYFFKVYIVISLVILLLTMIFKLKTGFFYRPGRYFLNGSIVFAWMMGVAGILSLFIYFEENIKKYFYIFIVFVFAVLWGFSKGPILSMFLIASLIIFFYRFSFKNLFMYVLILFGISLLFFLFKDNPMVARMLNVFLTDESVTDVSSINSRYQLFSVTIQLIQDNLFTGVGLANWQYFAHWGGAIYPHNFILEMLSEMGLIMSLICFVFMFYLLVNLNFTFFCIVSFLGVCMLFSGDLTYLRLFNVFLLSGFIINKERYV